MGALSRYKTFIFDWDGTLRSVSAARKLNSIVNPNWRRKKSVAHSGPDRSTPNDITANAKHVHTSTTLAKLRGAESEFFVFWADVSLKFMVPKLSYGAKPLLENLERRRASVALYTEGALWRVRRELDFLRVTDYFEAILSAQDVGRLKPDPLGLEVLLEALGAKKAGAIYVGDMKDDMLAAKNAGIASCAVTNGFESADMLKGVKPDYIFSSLEELAKEL